MSLMSALETLREEGLRDLRTPGYCVRASFQRKAKSKCKKAKELGGGVHLIECLVAGMKSRVQFPALGKLSVVTLAV